MPEKKAVQAAPQNAFPTKDYFDCFFSLSFCSAGASNHKEYISCHRQSVRTNHKLFLFHYLKLNTIIKE